MMEMNFTRKRLILAVAMLPFLLLSAQAFGQSAGVSGTVTDASRAVLPGATITATNKDTGLKTTVTTNNAGVYNFAALVPGSYEVHAEMPGVQTLKRTDINLVVGAQPALMFLDAGLARATQIEVTFQCRGHAAGIDFQYRHGKMDDKVAKELPLIGDDVMGLINVTGGVVKAENTIFGNSDQTFAGVRADNINITRDGISVNDARHSSGNCYTLSS